MAPVLALSLFVFAWEALDVQGGSTCPGPEDVAVRAGRLLPPGYGLRPGLTVRVDDVSSAPASADTPSQPLPPPRPGEIEVRLEEAGQSDPLASRRFERNLSCAELAEAIAVVVASWAGRYEVWSPPADDIATPGAKRPPADDLAVRRGPDVARPPAAITWSMGAAGWFGVGAEGGGTPLGGLEATARRRGGRWFARMVAAGSGSRELSVGLGAAVWSRLFLAPSVGRAWGDSFFFEASAGPVLGPVFVRGRGFSPNDSDVSLDIGLSPALRLGRRLGTASGASVWLGGAAIVWARPHRLSVDMAAARTTLPWWDVMAGGGLTYSFGP